MSFSQPLIISQQDYDVFAPSWQAGISGSQSLTKSLKNYDIESVNIAKTCEKLRLILTENSKTYETSTQHIEDDEKQCTIRKRFVPFRAFTNIWFGTLKIYQQQVNNLLRLSQDLHSRSCNYDIKHLETFKRKSSLKSQKLIKKRRLTLNESFEKTHFSNANYSQLLDDLEKISRESRKQQKCDKPSLNASRPITQLQIREITIREISATTFSMADVAIDDDSGFGEATHEEIAEFFNFVEDSSVFNNIKGRIKRKSTCEPDAPIKKKYYNEDYFEKADNNDNIKKDENFSRTTSLRRSTTPTKNYSIVKNNCTEYINKTPPNDFHSNYIDNQDFFAIGIKKEPTEVNENKQFLKKWCCKKKKLRLIIDECIKIDTADIIEEMKHVKVSTKLARSRIAKSYKSKKILTALELLTRFNRRSLRLSLTLKQTISLSREQFECEYLNLLREIFKINFNESWVSEIYPKWKSSPDAQQKRKCVNKTKKKMKTNEQPVADLYNLNEYLNTDTMDDINNNNAVYNVNKEIQNAESSCNKIPLNSCVYNDWRPYGVMMNLLKLWRINETNELAAKTLFKLAENRFKRALGFSSLLKLSKKHFVILTTFPKTIALQNILMGKAIKSNVLNKLS